MTELNACVACESPLPPSRGSRPRKYCNDRCRHWAKTRPGEVRPVGRTCRMCAAPIDHMATQTVYCSQACGQRGRAKDRKDTVQTRTCLQCQSEFRPYRSGSTCCSTRCYRTWWQKQWASSNPSKVRLLKQQMAARRTPEQIANYRQVGAAKSRRRRARKASNLCLPFSGEQLAQRLSMFPGCWLCGRPGAHVDHVKPIAKGGPHILANLRPICPGCNSRKGAQWPLEVPSVVSGVRVRR